MKILLVNTPINRQDTLGRFSSIYDDMKMVPTGIAGLAAFVRDQGHEVRILDQYAECLDMPAVFTLIEGFRPDLIGFSATTPNYYAAIDFVRHVRARFPEIPTVMGGYHPSICPDETLGNASVDFVIRDEGEATLAHLCAALTARTKDLSGVAGLSYKTPEGGVRHNPRAAIVDVNALPMPAYDLLPMHRYSSPSYTKFATPVYQMIASRGCPFHCTYCINAGMNVSAHYRKRDVRLVVDEMELLADRYGARQVQFWDPIFPLGEKHAFEFCEEVLRRNLHKRLVWNSTTRAELVTDPMLRIMAKAGCRGIGFGLESGVPGLLRSVQKKFDLEKARQACTLGRKNGLVVLASFILGFPGETPEMTQQTIDYAKSLDIHYAQFSIMVPYPGTPLYAQLMAQGLIAKDRSSDYASFNQSVGLTDIEPVFVPQGRSAQELKAAQRRAYVEFYFRPVMVWRHLPHLRPATLAGMCKSFWAVLKLFVQKATTPFRKP